MLDVSLSNYRRMDRSINIMQSIKILGTLRGVSIQSKEEDKRVTHVIGLKIELTEGIDRAQDIVSRVREIVEIEINPKQPHLGVGR